jgi:hypothetical protein
MNETVSPTKIGNEDLNLLMSTLSPNIASQSQSPNQLRAKKIAR